MEKLLTIWPSISQLAQDLGEPYSTVQCWNVRGVPARRFPQLIQAAKKRGHALTYEELHAMGSQSKGAA